MRKRCSANLSTQFSMAMSGEFTIAAACLEPRCSVKPPSSAKTTAGGLRERRLNEPLVKIYTALNNSKKVAENTKKLQQMPVMSQPSETSREPTSTVADLQ